VVQRELVEAGWFGRKSGRGFYDYAAGAQTPAVPSLEGPAPSSIEVAGDLGPAAGLVDRLQAAGISPRTSAGAGVINLPGATLALSDGRTATERAAVDGLSNLVLFDLIDFAKGTRVALAKADGAPASALAEAAGLFKAAGLAATAVDDTPGLVNLRTLSMLINEAAEAVLHGVASAADVDTAMMKGVNYPKGLLALADEVGARTIVKALDNLARTYGEDRYRASSLLRRMSVAGRRFHEGV
jgi:3-hydroxybutyryl-CoA dehydrogenase